MKKIFVPIILLFSISLSIAQIETLWETSAANGNLPAWFSATGNTERGFAYNPATERVYVVSRNGGIFVKALNSNTGDYLDDLDVTGISGGTFALNDIGSTEDGVLYGINLAIGASAEVKIYRWTSDSAVPDVAFQSNLGGADDKRIGDKFTVIRSASDNSVQIWLADATGQKVHVLTTADNGATFTLSNTISLPAGTLGGSPAVFPLPDDALFLTNSNGKNIQAWTFAGTLEGEIPGSLVGSGSNSLFVMNANDVPYIVTFQYGATTENARMVMIGDNPANAVTYVQTPSMFVNANLNGVGDVDIKYNTDGTQTIYVLSTNNGIGAYTISYPSLINGRFNEPYITMAEKLNNNNGFGDAIDIQRLYYYFDDTNLYLGLEGYLNTGSNDGIVLYLTVSNQTGSGAAAGTSLGNVPGGGHLFGNTGNPDFKNDFETQYAFVINPGNTDSVAFIDAVSYIGGPASQYIGMAYQNGSLLEGPGSDGIYTANSLKMAYYKNSDYRRGWELCIPLAEIGNPLLSDNVQLFAAVVSSTAFFSDVTVPGNISTGNPGFNPDFALIGGGPFNTGFFPLPVELTGFNANVQGNNVLLNWSTATEVNNRGFDIERSINNSSFVKIGFINGKGSSTEKVNYSFADNNLNSGTYTYRLKQIDLNGTFTYSNSVEVSIGVDPNTFELSQNYPNPFNPATSIKFLSGRSEFVTLRVYNVLGQEVANLFNQTTEAGKTYEVIFDASDFGSGVYFYSLEQGSKVITRKMILVK